MSARFTAGAGLVVIGDGWLFMAQQQQANGNTQVFAIHLSQPGIKHDIILLQQNKQLLFVVLQ